MRISKLNMDPERKIITGLITSDEFCRQIMPIFHPDHMKGDYSRIVGGWIQEFYENFKSAPGKSIQDIYREKRAGIKGDETSNLIAEFLKKLSEDYESETPNNVEYAVSQAVSYLKTRSLEVLVEDIEDAIQKNDPLLGEQILTKYNRIERATGEGVSIIHNFQEIADAFDEEEETLFRFSGALGDVAGDFHRGDFVSFMAPMKRGKTWWLWYTAESAMKKNLKVVFFTLEMTKRQMIRRGWRSIVGRPKKSSTVTVPYFSEAGNGKWEILTKDVEYNGIVVEDIQKEQRKLRRLFRKGDIKIVQLSGYQSTVAEVEAHLDNMNHYDNYVPDVIVIDYADLLAPSKKAGNEYRHKLDDIWKGLRKISQIRNILVVTASQTAKETFDRDIKQGDAAEDIRKVAHVTSAIGINQKPIERDKGIVRINQLAVREDKATSNQAVVIQCLDIGKACLDSKYHMEVALDSKQRGSNETK